MAHVSRFIETNGNYSNNNLSVFVVPKTEDMVRTLFDPRVKKSISDLVIVGVLIFYISLYFFLPPSWRITVYCLLFAFWRLAYNGGIGLLLDLQSKKKRLTKLAKKYRLFQQTSEKYLWHRVLRRDLSCKLVKDYNFYTAPIEYNTWLLFRHFVDLVLMSDFTNYIMLAVSCYSTSHQSLLLQVGRWLAGITLFFFNLWVKLDAHRVIKDYAWYWGDFFFLEEVQLTFDGVFELAPHPMYSIGYAGFYGICLMTASYTLFFASILAHIAQFAFLIVVENSHIEKTYNPPRVPKRKSTLDSDSSKKLRAAIFARASRSPSEYLPEEALSNDVISDKFGQHKPPALLILKNFHITRSSDILTILCAVNFLALLAVPHSYFWDSVVFFSALTWRLFHNWGLGYILISQSENKGWTRLFLKHGKTPADAYEQWQAIYNLSTTMSYVCLFVVCYRQRELTSNIPYWPFKYIIGSMLIALHAWTSFSIYESLGEFGWFFGDFFFPEEAKPLTYSGIYRYLNNPERLFGIVGVWGLALISGSISGYFLAFVWTFGGLIFIKTVEQPHMQKLYGGQIRDEAGLTKTFKRAAQISSPVNTVLKFQGSIDKVFSDTAQVLESFLGQAKPKIQSGVRDTRVLLKEYPSKLTIVRVSDDLGSIDTSLYSLEIITPSCSKGQGYLEFEYGTPLKLHWTADPKHSRRDWIGLYKITDNSSIEVTNVNARNHWTAIDKSGYTDHINGIQTNYGTSGDVFFLGDALIWETGVYQFRYHHDNKHSVVALSRPFSIIASPIVEQDAKGLSRALLPVVQLCFATSDYIPPLTIDEIWDLEDKKVISRITYAVKEKCGVDLAPEVLASDQSVKHIATRLAKINEALRPFVSNKPKTTVKIKYTSLF